MNLETAIGLMPNDERRAVSRDPFLIEYANLKLAGLKQPIVGEEANYPFMRLAKGLLAQYQEQTRLLAGHLSPVDQRAQNFIDKYLADLPETEPRPRLPHSTLCLDRHGLARVLCMPPDKDEFSSDIIKSYRVHNGVLHNPKNDRRTTKGVFHVAEGGLPIPADKLSVPKLTFARMLTEALNPPSELKQLPFTSELPKPAEVWASLLMRPVVCPGVEGIISEKRYEVRFFAPGNLVSNLDFVESIFGNAGDPFLPENDAAVDVRHWTGHTGCVILAPHLITKTKKELGLPHIDEATELQKRQGMCWSKDDELYNGGSAFKLTARDASGVIVTIIADNYFGYCKKEVKTQISFAANLYGLAEEEHAGGAIAFPSYDLGEEFRLAKYIPELDHSFEQAMQLLGDRAVRQPEGFAIDKEYPDIHYVPEDTEISLAEQTVCWGKSDGRVCMRLRPHITYVMPSGYKIEMLRPATEGRRWRLVGTTAEGTFCHKPCTVSGGGKSEISKSISDAIIYAPVIVADFEADFARVGEIIAKEYGMRFKDDSKNRPNGRKVLSNERTLGSVIKLLTPAPEYTDEYNAWLRDIPFYIKEFVFILKRFYKEDWEGDWRSRFSVDSVNGSSGNWLKYKEMRLVTQYLRIGYNEDGSWRIFGLRKDFNPAAKLQTEDDISAAVVMPTDVIPNLNQRYSNPSVKFIENCEFRLFQRPDDAIHRGYDKRTELDMSKAGNFFSNYEPLSREFITDLTEDAIRFEQYTEPMQEAIKACLADERSQYMVINSNPRIVDGAPTKNPRYLQDRDDLVDPRNFYLGEVGVRLFRRIGEEQGVPMPVNAVLPGRRNNPPQDGVRSLAVFNPIHYLPLPEFFMEIISSMTGKSPSTTGAGSEGALTKGPFNALPPIVDLNNALVSFVLTGYQPFITAAGYVGPKNRVDHDISLLVPEVWSRMKPRERDPEALISDGMLEAVPDVEFNGKTVRSSVLGYRITARFVRHYFGRVFGNPAAVLTDEMLKPELQGLDLYADGMDNILATHERVSALYFEDGSIDGACPPLKALLHIMRDGEYEGKTLADPEIRDLFSRKAMMESDWYQARLACRQQVEVNLWERHNAYLKAEIEKHAGEDQGAQQLDLHASLEHARETLAIYRSPGRINQLRGTLGTEPYLYR
ncbi:hypothetical protein [Cerasicoccus arenae]|uniref:PPi-type phosphoenolpyruvate carboxykinase lobe 2 domain-containing protein n=1 Tax=Cerasicoccus arenae TaxID=424488 RepID=A0A8J3DDK0_9BACT|nr:hypothetical protein [Cerasicoccus arenae]MBK1858477.1 hypothetical protein [Cerasicoccus arenae]GHC10414.1 hypothetical protein GCM10007047_29700 [Cerasicoccus arenae]